MRHLFQKAFRGKLRSDVCGFTLVELIVTLTIMAVLSAATVPSLVGYIGKAKLAKTISEAGDVYSSAQALALQKQIGESFSVPTQEEVLSASGAAGEILTMTFTDGAIDCTAEKPFRYKSGDIIVKFSNGAWVQDGECRESEQPDGD